VRFRRRPSPARPTAVSPAAFASPRRDSARRRVPVEIPVHAGMGNRSFLRALLWIQRSEGVPRSACCAVPTRLFDFYNELGFQRRVASCGCDPRSPRRSVRRGSREVRSSRQRSGPLRGRERAPNERRVVRSLRRHRRADDPPHRTWGPVFEPESSREAMGSETT
jgi:hypothetical protein